MQILPISNDSAQSFTTILGGVVLDFKFWLQESCWYCSIKNAGEDVLNGARLMSMAPIMRPCREAGALIPVAKADEPLEDKPWGITHELVYFTDAELAEIPQPTYTTITPPVYEEIEALQDETGAYIVDHNGNPIS